VTEKIRKVIVVKFFDASRKAQRVSITKASTPASVFEALKLPRLAFEMWDETQTDYFHLYDRLYPALLDFDVVWVMSVDAESTIQMEKAA